MARRGDGGEDVERGANAVGRSLGGRRKKPKGVGPKTGSRRQGKVQIGGGKARAGGKSGARGGGGGGQ